MEQPSESGAREIRRVFRESRRLFASAALFSAVVNLLMLTGPIFMLQIYDRVLTSRSEATLLTLTIMVAVLFLAMGLMDHARSRLLARAGAGFQARLDPRVLKATLKRSGASVQARSVPATGAADLETIQRFLSGPGPTAFFDAPWTPVFVAVLFIFHGYLGVLAVVAGLVMIVLAVANQASTAEDHSQARRQAAEAMHRTSQARAGGETVQALGMRETVAGRLARRRRQVLEATLKVSDRAGAFTSATRTLRQLFQSLMLALGGWLAIQGLITPGVIVAASILLGRALAPIDQAVAQWGTLQQVLEARRSLAAMLAHIPVEAPRPALPRPDLRELAERGKALIAVHDVDAAPPGAAEGLLRNVSFEVRPGTTLGIIGPSGAGKTTLARTLIGVWPPLSGRISLAGAEIAQYGEEGLSVHVGYLGQEAELFEGTVAENIARLDPKAGQEDVIAAARKAGAHDMILSLPGGYAFEVAAGGQALSGGQRRRVALARALYGNPCALILDEPAANLDVEGVAALQAAIVELKREGGAAVIIAHDPRTILMCDDIHIVDGAALKEASDAERRQRTLPGEALLNGREAVRAEPVSEPLPWMRKAGR